MAYYYLSADNVEFLFCVLFMINFLNFLDRGIIPGAANEFDSFINDHVDTDSPDVFLGILQSSFIVGFCIASLVFGHLLHYHSPFLLCGIGLSIWIVAVILSGGAYYVSSYECLVFARMLSGVGEASFQCSIPPFITSHADPDRKGMWLSVFYTAMPVGTAAGFAYAASIASSPNLGWQYCFFFESMLMFPFAAYMFYIAPMYPCEFTHRDDSVTVRYGDELSPIGSGNRRSHSKDSQGSGRGNEMTNTVGNDGQTSKSYNVDELEKRKLERRYNTNSLSSEMLNSLPNNSTASLQRPTPNRTNKPNYEEDDDEDMTVTFFSFPSALSRSNSVSSGRGTPTLSPYALLTAALADQGDGSDAKANAPSVFDEVYVICCQPLFILSTLGYAAQIGSLVGISTYGSAFLIGLGYFDSEAEASSVFGGVVCVAGVIGTPIGGMLMDMLLLEQEKVEFLSGGGGGATATANNDGSNSSTGRKNSSDTSEETILQQLQVICRLVGLATACGMLLLSALFFISSKILYIFVVLLGCCFIFMCSAAINLSIMLSVPYASRSIGIAVSSVAMHVLGDVPSPIIVGMIKDLLAPACVGGDDDGDAAASDACRNDSDGLRLTMLLVCSWLLWTVICSAVSWFVCLRSSQRIFRLRHLGRSRDSKDSGILKGYNPFGTDNLDDEDGRIHQLPLELGNGVRNIQNSMHTPLLAEALT